MSLVVPPDPLTVPTWLTAIFTGVLAVGAIVTAIFAILAFRKQSTEVSILQQQAQRDSEERRRSQASRVFIWQDFEDDPEAIEHSVIAAGPDLPLYDTCPDEIVSKEWTFVELRIRNTSDQPVYDLATRWRSGSSEWHGPNREAVLLPGDEVLYLRNVGVPAGSTFDPLLFDALVAFRDAAGVMWLRRPDGDLQEQQ